MRKKRNESKWARHVGNGLRCPISCSWGFPYPFQFSPSRSARVKRNLLLARQPGEGKGKREHVHSMQCIALCPPYPLLSWRGTCSVALLLAGQNAHWRCVCVCIAHPGSFLDRVGGEEHRFVPWPRPLPHRRRLISTPHVLATLFLFPFPFSSADHGSPARIQRAAAFKRLRENKTRKNKGCGPQSAP